MNARNRNLLEVHVAVFLFGLAGLFGKFLSLPSIVIVFGRVFFATIALSFILWIGKQKVFLHFAKNYFTFVLLGVVLAVHWVTFFHSIQISSVAVGLITFSTFPVFVAFLEPIFFQEKLRIDAIILAIITFLGVILVIPQFDLGDNVTQGALWGIASGATFALLSLLNRKYVQQFSSLVIALYQDAIAAVVLLPFVLYLQPTLLAQDIALLIVLGVVFTAIAHSLFIKGMTHVKVQVASIIASLESVYGVVFAAILLGEIPSLRTIVGGIIILGAALWATRKQTAEVTIPQS